ncbi:putative reverse transcriptase-2 [Daphnia sinensis]|uniref:Reverse transcriptase-2 n=2 Tax=Daphnia sinensis TaxID=1820382 RepID=A0AAD5L3K4_9CRUS|nr:putative reverse transcriptase-2 [Daphnia sinensis]
MDGSQGSPNPAHSSLPTFSPSRIEGDKIILKYPGKPTKCPRCEWTTLATNTRAMGSIHRHLETAHTLRLVKYWECGVCGFAGDGPTLKGHYQRLHSNPNPSPSIPFAGMSSMDGSNHDSSAAVISLEEVAATEDERDELSVVEIPAIEESPKNINPQILSEEILDPSPNPEILSYVPSQQSNRGRRLNSSEEQSQRDDDFVSLWAPAFLSCETLNDLNDVLERCTADWLPKSQILQDPSPEQPRGNPDQRKRNQNRQMQRARRAVREVLEDRSPSYDGTVQAAEEYLKRTYNRLRPSPQQCQSARELYDTCDWSQPSEDQMNFLNRAPTQQELQAKLRRATNTSPGVDGLEYRHLRAIDPNCILLVTVCKMVWKLGIPNCWKTSRTVPIFKKGDTSDYSNFRPISLLPTIYKLFSGVISQRITEVASDLGWLSPEQKGFLPGVHGIQEHTQLLQTVVEETKTKRRHMSIAWLDMCNAFGSVPHAVLNELFTSLPIPEDLRRILVDIYSGNRMDFAVGKESIRIFPTAGVRQGDALSSPIFNLASEPIVRAGKSNINHGFLLFGSLVKTTAYADDIAVVANSPSELQNILNVLSLTANTLGLQFNAGKCACLVFDKGKPSEAQCRIGEQLIRCLGPDDQESYLGTPIGGKLRFRPPTDLILNLDKIAASNLAPWQKLEIFRSHLLPSLSHHLASGRVLKDSLTQLDTECRKFLGLICNLPNHATVPFFYADRRVGGLGTCRLTDDADIWTIARAAQLLTCRDPTVRNICREQLHDTIRRGFRTEHPGVLPVGEYLSGSVDGGLYRLRYAEAGSNLWTLAHLLETLLVKQGHDVTVNKAIPGQRLRPDVEFLLSGSRVMVDVVVCYDQPGSMENAYQRKIEKYSSLGRILPLVVGSLGSWNPRNEDIRSILGIDGRTWGAFRFKARLAAIQGSMEMVCAHFHHGATNPEDEDIPFSHVESPLPVD